MKKFSDFSETEKRIMRAGKGMEFASIVSRDTLTMGDINPDLIRKRDKENVDRMLKAVENSECETTK